MLYEVYGKCGRAFNSLTPLNNTYMQEFKIHSYSLTELALIYRPHLSPRSAARTLRNWIRNNPELLMALSDTGFNPEAIRTHTPMQVSIIVSYLGEP